VFRTGCIPLLFCGLLAASAAAQEDPIVLRMRILARMDREIDQAAAAAHLRARLLLDELMPIPYLGVDAEAEGDGMRVTHVYPATGAADAGLQEGDVILFFCGEATPSREALGTAIRTRTPGEEVEFKVRRGDEMLTLKAPLGRRPEEDEDEEEQFPEIFRRDVAPPKPVTLPFTDATPGETPALLEGVLAGHGQPGRWIVVESADGGRALRQAEADRTGIRFPIVLVRDLDCADATVRVRFRYEAGDVDRAAGVVLRFRDKGNYLVARANAVESDLRIFRVVNGLRRTLPGARAEAVTGDGKWHTLEFRAEGPKVTAVLDGTATVTSYDTYLRRGRVGLWTKSDSVTDFDDLAVVDPK